jgi:hypothetical protein
MPISCASVSTGVSANRPVAIAVPFCALSLSRGIRYWRGVSANRLVAASVPSALSFVEGHPVLAGRVGQKGQSRLPGRYVP